MNKIFHLSRSVFLLCLSLLMAEAVSAEVKVVDAYVRGLPPGQPVTAAFMRLLNTGDQTVVISGASTASAERAEIHAHLHRNGMMGMEKVDSIRVPANGEFVLAPGKHHLMLINLTAPLREGDQVDLDLQLADGRVISVQLPVRSVLNEHQHH